MSRPEWADFPIDCQKVADIAQSHYKNPTIPPAGSFRYTQTHLALTPTNLENLGKGQPCVLLTSSSDSSVDSATARRLPSNVLRWFSTNVETDDPRVEAIPIGFIFNTDRLSHMRVRADSWPQPKVNLMYTNFTRHALALRGRRDGLYEQFGKFDWNTTKGGTSHDDVNPHQYYLDLSTHWFVLSPPGAGPDCHRHWEAMAMGAIPIVLRSKAVQLLEDMPALLVSSWEEVTRDRLEAAIKELTPRFHTPVMRKLSMLYWLERMSKWVQS